MAALGGRVAAGPQTILGKCHSSRSRHPIYEQAMNSARLPLEDDSIDRHRNRSIPATPRSNWRPIGTASAAKSATRR